MKASNVKYASMQKLSLKSSVNKRDSRNQDQQGNHANNNQLGLEVQARDTQLGLKNPKILIGLLIALLTVAVVSIIWFSNTNATGALAQVNFPKVSIAEGSKFYLNGGKSLTAIKDGKLFADNTNGTAVEGSQISSELTSFANSQYGSDAGKNYLTNPNLLSLEKLNNSLHLIPTTDSDYWLADTYTLGGVSIRAFRLKNNSETTLNKSLTGSYGGQNFQNESLKSGYDFAETSKMRDIVIPGSTTGEVGWKHDLSISMGFRYNFAVNPNITDTYAYLNMGVMRNTYVYNNPYLIEDPSRGFYKSSIDCWGEKNSKMERYATPIHLLAVIEENNGDVKLKKSYIQDLSRGTVVCSSIAQGGAYPISKPNGGGTVYYRMTRTAGFSCDASGYYNIYFALPIDVKTGIGASFGYPRQSADVYGAYNIIEGAETIEGTSYVSGKYAIRPTYDFDSSQVAFLRDSQDKSVAYSSSLSVNLPISNALYGNNYVGATKSSDLKVNCEISADNIETNYGAKAPVVVEGDTIKVPYGTTTLSFKNFSLTNANNLSALASDKNGTLKYGVLQSSNSSVFDLDITNLVDNQFCRTDAHSGSSATVSLYAEQVNGNGQSDIISDSAVTFKIEVAEGLPQTITYDVNGGEGSAPASATVKSGELINGADGSHLIKDNNHFSAWKMTYIPLGKSEEVSRYVTSNQPFTVPLTDNSKILMTAQYSGISAKKTTDTTSSVITVTWDTNAPEGTTASWGEDIEGQYNGTRSIRYDKVKLPGKTVILPSTPSSNSDEWTFDGWYTDKTGGTKLTGQTPAINKNVTYYAHWLNGYTVTFDLNAPSGGTCQWGSTTSPNTLTSLAKPTGYIIENPSGVTGSPTCTSDTAYVFCGWYDAATGGNLIEIGASKVSGNKTIYAHWVRDVFLAKVDGTNFDPTNLSTYGNADITDIADVKAAATTIAGGGTNPDSTKYNATNDQYHLFARIGGSSTSTTANDWLECRIIHVGQHDNDESGLTFQAVHAWKTRYVWDSSVGNWSSCTLRTTMNSTIYNTLPDLLKTNIRQVTKKSNETAGSNPNGGSTVTTSDKLFILSYTEFVKNSTSSSYWNDESHDGSVYQFWSSQNLSIDTTPSSGSTQQQLLYKLNSDRSGTLVKDPSWSYSASWQRSVDPYDSKQVLNFNSYGRVRSNDGIDISNEDCVAPAFAM